MSKKEITAPVEGCTKCWCGAKYWDFRGDGIFCHSCGERFYAWHFILDQDGIPQVTLDGISLVW